VFILCVKVGLTNAAIRVTATSYIRQRTGLRHPRPRSWDARVTFQSTMQKGKMLNLFNNKNNRDMISAFCEELSRDRTGFTRVKETYSQVKNAAVTREQNFRVKVRRICRSGG
jgi:hypothetical protein